MKQDWHGVRLIELIETQLAPFVGSNGQDIEIDGSDVFIAAKAVQVLGLALHELATNATKYGALSVPGGKIALSWNFHEGGVAPDAFRLTWRERGGPAVKPSKRKGFGNFVMEQMVKREIDAAVKTTFAPEGIVWTFDMPASHVVRSDVNGSNARTSGQDEKAP